MPSKKITKENVIANRKQIIINIYNIMAVSFVLTVLFTLLIPTVVLFFVISGNPANDIGPIILVISIVVAVISFIITVISFIYGLKYRNKKNNLFTKEEKNKYISSYLPYLVIRYTLLSLGIGLIINGLYLKNKDGVLSTYIGLILTIFGLCSTIYAEVKKAMYKDNKSSTTDDIILSNSILFNLSLTERSILSVVLIAVIVMIFNLIAGNLNSVFKIILIILSILMYLYNLYVCVKVNIKYNKNRKNEN